MKKLVDYFKLNASDPLSIMEEYTQLRNYFSNLQQSNKNTLLDSDEIPFVEFTKPTNEVGKNVYDKYSDLYFEIYSFIETHNEKVKFYTNFEVLTDQVKKLKSYIDSEIRDCDEIEKIIESSYVLNDSLVKVNTSGIENIELNEFNLLIIEHKNLISDLKNKNVQQMQMHLDSQTMSRYQESLLRNLYCDSKIHVLNNHTYSELSWRAENRFDTIYNQINQVLELHDSIRGKKGQINTYKEYATFLDEIHTKEMHFKNVTLIELEKYAVRYQNLKDSYNELVTVDFRKSNFTIDKLREIERLANSLSYVLSLKKFSYLYNIITNNITPGVEDNKITFAEYPVVKRAFDKIKSDINSCAESAIKNFYSEVAVFLKNVLRSTNNVQPEFINCKFYANFSSKIDDLVNSYTTKKEGVVIDLQDSSLLWNSGISTMERTYEQRFTEIRQEADKEVIEALRSSLQDLKNMCIFQKGLEYFISALLVLTIFSMLYCAYKYGDAINPLMPKHIKLMTEINNKYVLFSSHGQRDDEKDVCPKLVKVV